MSSFVDVQSATCQIVTGDGQQMGTGFFVLPDGYLLTCHHVIYGLDRLHVRLSSVGEIQPAEYIADRSDPEGDIAVLFVAYLKNTAVQIGRARDEFEAAGVGFRPSTAETEPRGHSFSGLVSVGQELRLRPPVELSKRLQAVGPEQRLPWNTLPQEFRKGEVLNFETRGALERGISGGPVYDRGLHRVVGLFRAIEGSQLAYVIPIDHVLRVWPELGTLNEIQVRDDPLYAIANRHRLALVAEGTRPIVPLAWDIFRPVFSKRSRFGGRGGELAKLDHFLREEDRGYYFVTGPSGFGKTALLCHWASRLREAGVATVINFLRPQTTEQLLLTSLCEQLLALHGFGGDVPNDVDRLFVLYADLLKLDTPHDCLAIVVDGLDEVLGEWTPDERLFPRELGAGVHVVCSARNVANRDWLTIFGLPITTPSIELSKLSEPDIHELLVQAGVLDNLVSDQLMPRMIQLSDGDPFYVQDLLEELTLKGFSLDSLKAFPVGHSTYLKQWWMEAQRRNPGRAFVDLMGSLAALREPIGRTELIRLSPEDELVGANIDTLLEDASRYIDGNAKDGYELRHDRIRRFVRDTLDDGFAVFHTRLAEFCAGWKREDRTSAQLGYALRHGVAHGLAAGGREQTLELLTPEWIAEKWSQFGSYRGLIGDLSQIAEVLAEPVNPPAVVAQTIQVAIAEATVREIMGGFPIELLQAWVALGGGDRVRDVVGSLSDSNGDAAKPLLATAEALVDERYLQRSINSAQETEHVTLIVERAISLVPLVRTSMEQVRIVRKLSKLLVRRCFEASQRKALFAYALSVARGFDDPAVRAPALATLAGAMADFDDDGGRASDVLQEAVTSADCIPHGSDWLLARAELLPAMRRLSPGRLPELIQSSLSPLEAVPPASSMGKDVVGTVLRRWDPVKDADLPWVVPLLLKLAALYLVDPLPEEVLPPDLLRSLIALGEAGRALDLLNELSRRSPLYGAYLFLDIADKVFASNEQTGKIHLERADSQVDEALYGIPANRSGFRGQLALAHAARGDWPRTFKLVTTIDTSRLDSKLVPLIELAAKDVVDAVALDRIARLVALGNERLQEQDLVGVMAVAARTLAWSAPDVARSYLERAIQSCLKELHEGDCDALRHLEALALLEEGVVDKADATTNALQWTHGRIKTYAALVKGSKDATTRDFFVQQLITSVQQFADATFLVDVARTIRDAVLFLVQADAVRARVLCNALKSKLSLCRLWVDFIRCGGSLTRARWEIDRRAAARELNDLILRSRAAPIDDQHYWFEELDVLSAVMPKQVARALAILKPPAELARKTNDFKAWSAYLIALAKVDAQGALTGCEHLVASLMIYEPELVEAPHLQRMIAEITSSFTGLDLRPDLVEAVTKCVLACASADIFRCQAMAKDVLTYALKSSTENARAEAAGRFFVQLAAATWDDDLFVALYRPAVIELRAALPAERTDQVLLYALARVPRLAQLDRARQVAGDIQSSNFREQAAVEMSSLEELVFVHPDTPFLTAYVSGQRSDLALHVLHSVQFEGTTKEVLVVLAQRAREPGSLSRSRLMSEWAPLATLPLKELAGPQAISQLVIAIDDFDQRLVRAATLIAQRA